MLTLNFPSFPVIYTERLILREHALTDAGVLFAMRNDERVMAYINRERPNELADAEKLIALMADNYLLSKNLVWVIALRDNPGQMIGSIGYYRTDFANYRAEVGYMILPTFWRQGLVAEALKKVITFGFEEIKLHSISAHINPANDASRQMLLRHGFVKEALFRENYYFNGEFLDSEIYSLLAREVKWTSR